MPPELLLLEQLHYNLIRLGNLLTRMWQQHEQLVAQRCGQVAAIRQSKRFRRPETGCPEALIT